MHVFIITDRSLQCCNTTNIHWPFYTYGITDCYDALLQGHNESGVYSLQINNVTSSVDVFCDMETDGEGWTVLLKRQDGSVDFYRNWADYKNGFGDFEGEHWLGWTPSTFWLTSAVTHLNCEWTLKIRKETLPLENMSNSQSLMKTATTFSLCKGINLTVQLEIHFWILMGIIQIHKMGRSSPHQIETMIEHRGVTTPLNITGLGGTKTASSAYLQASTSHMQGHGTHRHTVFHGPAWSYSVYGRNVFQYSQSLTWALVV